jgi:tetratricopeptide (TPR) repeat protein
MSGYGDDGKWYDSEIEREHVNRAIKSQGPFIDAGDGLIGGLSAVNNYLAKKNRAREAARDAENDRLNAEGLKLAAWANPIAGEAQTEFINNGKYEEAIDFFQKNMSDMEYVPPQFLAPMGLCYAKLGDLKNALYYCNSAVDESFKQFVYMDGNYARMCRAYVYTLMKDWKKAKVDSEMIMDVDFTDANERNIYLGEAFYYRGQYFESIGKTEMAVKDFKMATDYQTAVNYNDRRAWNKLTELGIAYTPGTPKKSIKRGKFLAVFFGLALSFGGSLTIGWIYNNLTGAAKFPVLIFLILMVVGFIFTYDSWRSKQNKLFLILLALSVPGWLIMFHILPERISTPKAKTESTQTVTVTKQADITQNVNFRKEASADSEVIRQLKKGDMVTLTGEVSGNWTQITHNSEKGWVSKEYLKIWGE